MASFFKGNVKPQENRSTDKQTKGEMLARDKALINASKDEEIKWVKKG